MDSRDKQFDNWMNDRLNAEIPLSKQNRQAAWEKIHLTASQLTPAAAFSVEDELACISTAVVAYEPFHARMWHWVSYFITQETSYHKAHANSVQHYKATPNYSGGLTLHSLELMRHRWTCAV